MPVSEFSLIARYFSALGRGPDVVLGVGDDCAILRLEADEQLAVSTDTVLSGSHFPEDAFPEDIGWRAVAVAASDLAAMGARPLGMTLALTLPEADEFWLHSFSEGLAAVSSALSLPLVGGDTSRGPLAITVTVMGALPQTRALRRTAAVAGDGVYVSGSMGDGAAALAFIEDRWQPAPEHAQYLLTRFYRPDVDLNLGQQLLPLASAAIDVSDGLLADAGHIAAASGVAMRLDASLLPLSPALQSHPDNSQVLRWALTGGDDYRLCFTAPRDAALPPGCTRIGVVEAGDGVSCFGAHAEEAGYQHF